MFQESSWESDKATTSLSEELCQTYKSPKQKKIKKSSENSSHGKPKKGLVAATIQAASPPENIQNKFKHKDKKVKLKEVGNSNLHKREKIEQNGVESNSNAQEFKSSIKIEKTSVSSKKNKYKNSLNQSKNIVGKDRRSVDAILDVPKTLKFKGQKLSDFTKDEISKELMLSNVKHKVKRNRSKSRHRKISVTDGNTDDNKSHKFFNEPPTNVHAILSNDNTENSNIVKKDGKQKSKKKMKRHESTADSSPDNILNNQENLSKKQKLITTDEIKEMNEIESKNHKKSSKIKVKKDKSNTKPENDVAQKRSDGKNKSKSLSPDKKKSKKRKINGSSFSDYDNGQMKQTKKALETSPAIPSTSQNREETKNPASVKSSDNSLKSPFNIARLKFLLAEDENNITAVDEGKVGNKVKDLEKGNVKKSRKNKKKTAQVNEFSDQGRRIDDDIKSVRNSRKNTGKNSPLTLKEKLQERLNSARFRYLNEQLYTQTGKQAQKLFRQDPEAFDCYHSGFQSQVNKWPVNPVVKIINYIKEKSNSLIVADFGCGEAKIAQSVKNKVYSFDLVAVNIYVTSCDIAKVPLDASSTDIVVFCLSLMGTNLVQYLCEAHRVLKHGGRMLVAEVASRFESLRKFKRGVEKLGFTLENHDETNKMFLWFEFKKTGKLPADHQLPDIQLDPCIYKRR